MTFNVADGTYNERVTISQAIDGASAVNTITFQSQSLDSTAVVITYQSTTSSPNWSFKVGEADYITIRKMTLQATGSGYGRVFDFNGNVTNFTLENCRILVYNTTSSYNEHALLFYYDDKTENMKIQNNVFSNGSFGMYLLGDASSNLSTGTEMLNNEFTYQSQYEVRLKYHDSPIVNYNIMDLDGTEFADGSRDIYRLSQDTGKNIWMVTYLPTTREFETGFLKPASHKKYEWIKNPV